MTQSMTTVSHCKSKQKHPKAAYIATGLHIKRKIKKRKIYEKYKRTSKNKKKLKKHTIIHLL